MAHQCESCGHTPEQTTTWLVEPDGEPAGDLQRPVGTRRSVPRSAWLVAAATALVLWAAFALIGGSVSPSDGIDAAAAADLEQKRINEAVAQALAADAEERAAEEAAVARTQAELEATESDPAGETPEADGAPAVDPGDPDRAPVDASPIGNRGPTTVQVERMQRQLSRRASNPIIAYASADGIVLIDMVAARPWLPELGADATPVAGTPVLRLGPESYAIDPVDLSVNRVGTGSSMVVAETADGNAYFVDSKTLTGQASLVEVVADGVYDFFRMPTGGFQLLAADGLGLLAVPKGGTGETLIAAAEGFVPLSSNRVLAGTNTSLLEQTCVDDSACTLAIFDLVTGESSPVPPSFVRFGDRYVLAPNGQGLLRYSPEGFGEVYTTGTDSISWIIGAGMEAPVWGRQSDVIIWIDRIGAPKIKLMFPDERDWLTIDIGDLGAPPPISNDLLVFERP
jgi:hypothetical protein